MLPLLRCDLRVVYHGCLDVSELLGQKEMAYRSKIVSTAEIASATAGNLKRMMSVYSRILHPVGGRDRYWWVRAMLVHMKIRLKNGRSMDGLRTARGRTISTAGSIAHEGHQHRITIKKAIKVQK